MAYTKANLIDIVFLQETWIRKCDGSIVKEIKEYDYDILSCRKPRKLDWGGGVATIYRNNLKVKHIRTENYKSFESVVSKVLSSNGAVLLVNLYRPDYSEKNKFTVKQFLEEFLLFLEVLRSYLFPIIIVGDLNIHVELLRKSDSELTKNHLVKKKDAISFSDVLNPYDFHQIIVEPTHERGGTLDLLILSSCALPLLRNHSVGLKNEVCVTDHFPVRFNLKLTPDHVNSKHTYISHNLRNLSIDNVYNNLETTGFLDMPLNQDLNAAVNLYNHTLSDTFLKHCPPQVKSVKSRPHQRWFTEELRDLKRTRR